MQNAERGRQLPLSQPLPNALQQLANGWPIASGPVEGACKNLIKDLMERSGMRWTEQMAEAIVQLRAIYLSGDFEAYWQFHIEQDQRRSVSQASTYNRSP